MSPLRKITIAQIPIEMTGIACRISLYKGKFDWILMFSIFMLTF